MIVSLRCQEKNLDNILCTDPIKVKELEGVE